MIDWLKKNWLLLLVLVGLIIVAFNTCKIREYPPIIIFPDSIDKSIDYKLDSLLKREYVIESNETVIKNNYKNETQNFINLPDTAKPSRISELARELLK